MEALKRAVKRRCTWQGMGGQKRECLMGRIRINLLPKYRQKWGDEKGTTVKAEWMGELVALLGKGRLLLCSIV
jgi:hypothetical protein